MPSRPWRAPKTIGRQAALSLSSVLLLLPFRPRCRHVWEDELCVPTQCRACGRVGYPTASMHDYETGD